MTDGTFLSRAWPSIVALIGTVAVVLGLLFLFGDDGSGADETSAGDDTATDENTDGGPAIPDPDAEQTGDGGETGGGTTSPDPGEAGDGEKTANPDGTPSTPVEAPPELRTPVGILNSTSIAGLAAGAQERFIEGGWEVPATTNYSGDVEGTIAYYPTDELRASAEALQAQFPEIRFVELTPSDENLAPERIVVILAEDYADAVGASEESG